MRDSIKIYFAFAMTLCFLANEASSQNTAPLGFRFNRDANGQVFVAEYWGDTGLRSGNLHQLKQLECVDITYGTELSKDDIAYLSRLTSIKELVIGQDLVDSPVAIQGNSSELKKLKALESVHICKQDIRDSDLKFIASLPKLTCLEFVAESSYDDNSNLTNECAGFLAHAKSLEYIHVQGQAKFTDRFIAKITSELPLLESVHLASDKLTDDSLRSLANNSAKLKRLNLRSKQFTDAGIRHLAAAVSLRELNIESPMLTKACLSHVSKLENLKYIELTIPEIDDDGVAVLANLRKLESFALRRVEFSDRQIAMFQNHPRIERAFLQGADLSDEVVMKLIAEVPNLKHLSVGSKNPDLQALVNRTLLRKPKTRD